jgi:hypothetical protein
VGSAIAKTPYDLLIRFHAALSAAPFDLADATRKIGLDEVFTEVELKDRYAAVQKSIPGELRKWREHPSKPRLSMDDRLEAWARSQGILHHVVEQLVKPLEAQDSDYRAALTLLNTPTQRHVAEALHMAAFTATEIVEIMGKVGLTTDAAALDCYFEHFFDTRDLSPTNLENWVVRLEARAASHSVYVADAAAKRCAIESPRDAEAILAIFGLNRTDTKDLLDRVLHEATAMLYASLIHRRNQPARPAKEVKNLLTIVKTLLRMKEHLPGAGASIIQPQFSLGFPDENGDLVAWEELNRRRKESGAGFGPPRGATWDRETMVDGRISAPEPTAEK